jgi:hypothetical protein
MHEPVLLGGSHAGRGGRRGSQPGGWAPVRRQVTDRAVSRLLATRAGRVPALSRPHRWHPDGKDVSVSSSRTAPIHHRLGAEVPPSRPVHSGNRPIESGRACVLIPSGRRGRDRCVSEQSTGVVALPVTDIGGWTHLLQALPDACGQVLVKHRATLGGGFAAFWGRNFGSKGPADFVASGALAAGWRLVTGPAPGWTRPARRARNGPGPGHGDPEREPATATGRSARARAPWLRPVAVGATDQNASAPRQEAGRPPAGQ